MYVDGGPNVSMSEPSDGPLGSQVTVTATVSSGAPPYSHKWTILNGTGSCGNSSSCKADLSTTGAPARRLTSLTLAPSKRVSRRRLAFVLCAVAISGVGVGCSSTTAPKARPTLLVTNALCTVGPCRTLIITAFIESWYIPQPPNGIKTLGYVRGATTCLQFPAKWTTEWGQEGGALHQLTWTPTNPAGIYLLAFDSAFTSGTATTAQYDSASQKLWPYQAPDGLVGLTPTFVPGSAPAWSVTFPPASHGGTAEPPLTPTSTACNP